VKIQNKFVSLEQKYHIRNPVAKLIVFFLITLLRVCSAYIIGSQNESVKVTSRISVYVVTSGKEIVW
jgi:hypothetical protein